MAQGQKKHGPFAKWVLKGTPRACPTREVRGHAPLGKILKSWSHFSPQTQLSNQTGHPLCTNCSNNQSLVTYRPRKAFLEYKHGPANQVSQ